jgi:hypothetical protein
VAQQSMYFANKTPSNFLWMGVNYDFPLNTNLIGKNWDGNTVFLHGPAMSAMELQLCLNKGKS